MSERTPSTPGACLGPLARLSEGRLVSVVHILKARRSIFSRLGVLELDNGSLSLRIAKGALLFAVPAASVEARPRRRIAVYPRCFEVHASDRWWSLVAWAPAKHQRRSTRELVERSQARELVPGMGEDDGQLLMKNPVRHQILWKECWLAALTGAAESSPQV